MGAVRRPCFLPCARSGGAGGGAPAVRIHEDRFFARVLSGGNLGLGEASMDGDWEMEEGDQEDPLTPLVRNRIDRKVKGGRTDRR
jgi:cyclopropane-fatty-acyl-phospholipid synthase